MPGGIAPGPGTKGNESTAILHLLDRMVLKEAVVTLDTVGCQTVIVQDLWVAEANHVSAPSATSPTCTVEMAAAFADAERDAFTPKAQDRREAVEHNSGRTGWHTCAILGAPGLCK